MSSDGVRGAGGVRQSRIQPPDTSPTPNLGAKTSPAGEESAPISTPGDRIETASRRAAKVTGGGATPAQRAASELDADTQRLQRENPELARRLDRVEESMNAREEHEADEARKPSFLRALMEIGEFIGRWLTPFVNAISLAVRALRICYMLIAGKEINWKKEGLRAAGDLVGIFFPPAGAIANAGLNLWFNESELLGGINQLWDKAEVQNPFRRGAVAAWNTAGEMWQRVRGATTDDAVEPGSERDDGVRPLIPQEVVI